MDSKCLVNMLNYKNSALVELIQLMEKYRLSFEAEHASVRDTTVLRIKGDYFEDGEPLELTHQENDGNNSSIDFDTIYFNEFNATRETAE